jgi:hypothetical protein
LLNIFEDGFGFVVSLLEKIHPDPYPYLGLTHGSPEFPGNMTP